MCVILHTSGNTLFCSQIYALLSVKFPGLKICECKNNDKYQVCPFQNLSPAAQLLEMHLVLWAVSAAENLSPTAQFFTFCGSASFAWPALGCSSRPGHPSFSLNRHLTTVSSSSSAFEYSCQYFQYYINHIFKLG